MGDFFVYGLFDPRNGELRYVGLHQGRLEKRLSEHLCKARSGIKLHIYDWMRQLISLDSVPEIKVLEACPTREEMIASEIRHIAAARKEGARLTNHTDGGEGCFGYRHSLEIRRKISKAKAGKPHTERWMLSRRILAPSQEREIVSIYGTGISCKAIGERFGLTGGGIRKILMRSGVRVRNAGEQRWLSERFKR